MSKKISDLITHIQTQLKDVHDKKNVVKGATPVNTIPKPADKDLSAADDNDLKTAAQYAVTDIVKKWQTDDIVAAPLKIKGSEMVKAVTGLTKKQ
jgi:hypothetical protein